MGATELHAYVKARLPLWARVAGPEVIERVVDDAIVAWPSSRLARCQRGSECENGLLAEVVGRVRGKRRYGFIWTLVLSSLLSAVVRAMLDWWLSRPDRPAKMIEWKQEMRGRDEQR